MGPCFISAAGITLGVDVADFFQLECPFQTSREIELPTEIEEGLLHWQYFAAMSADFRSFTSQRLRAP